MPKTALVSCHVPGQEKQGEGFGIFGTHFAALLKEVGDEVCAIVAYPEAQSIQPNSCRWQNLRSRNIEVVEVQGKPQKNLWPDIWVVRLSEQVAPLLRSFDVVYFSDLANMAFHTVRIKRFTADAMPICVTVLHGPSSWRRLCRQEHPKIPEDLNIDFVERYAARHSDFVVASSQQVLEWAKSKFWGFPQEPRVLGLPSSPEISGTRRDFENISESWIEFHKRVCQRIWKPRHGVAAPGGSKPPAVDICVPYYNKPRHFPQLLESLDRQTTQDFTVIAVDDGSTGHKARAVFNAMAHNYRPRGWTFFSQPNGWVDAARNQAAKRGTAEYLLMVDADDVPARNAVERMLEAARLSGDDCLVCASCLFAGDAFPYDKETGELTAPLFGYHMPLGPNLTAGLLEPEVFGGPMILIRRKTFEALGGYRELRGAAHEDWELHSRLALAGCKTDVVPEYLHFYRRVEDGLSRISDDFAAKGRIIESYDKCFASVKVYGAAAAMYSLYRHCRDLESRVNRHRQADGGTPLSWLIRPDRFGPRQFAKDDRGPLIVRTLRRAYRRALPLSARLRFRERLMKLAGRDPHS
jgi:GT2 family glycosyltransferase